MMFPIRRGFTLIELLVVISIIALLIAILLPVLSSARQAAIDLQCLANLKQNGVAFNAFMDENKHFFPPCFQDGLPNDGEYVLAGILYWNSRLERDGYSPISSNLCPDVPKHSGDDGSANWREGYIYQAGRLGHYGMNWYLSGINAFSPNYSYDAWKADGFPSWKRDEMKSPSDMLVIADSYYTSPSYPGYEFGYYIVSSAFSGTYTKAAVRHGSDQGPNVLWGDGHASFEPIYSAYMIDPKYYENPDGSKPPRRISPWKKG